MEVLLRGKRYWVEYTIEDLAEHLYAIDLINVETGEIDLEIEDLPKCIQLDLFNRVNEDAWSTAIDWARDRRKS